MTGGPFALLFFSHYLAGAHQLLELQSEVFKLRIDLLLGPICRWSNFYSTVDALPGHCSASGQIRAPRVTSQHLQTPLLHPLSKGASIVAIQCVSFKQFSHFIFDGEEKLKHSFETIGKIRSIQKVLGQKNNFKNKLKLENFDIPS